MILTWEILSITKLKLPSISTEAEVKYAEPLKAKQQNTQKEKETLRGLSV